MAPPLISPPKKKHKMKVIVTINRGPKNIESFKGDVIGETTTHYKVSHRENPIVGELFAKDSKCVYCRKAIHKSPLNLTT